MEFKTDYDEIWKFLTDSDEGITLNNDTEKLVSVLPQGWKKLTRTILMVKHLFQDSCELKELKMEKGLLRITLTSEADDVSELLNRLAHSIARESANTCLVCGVWGVRRKIETYSPSFCVTHYIEYVNYLDQTQPYDSKTV
jgi:hypothetical protein